MTKREEYGLEFVKIRESVFDWRPIYVCKCNGNKYGALQIITQLIGFELQCLIDEIENALKGQYYEEYYVTDSTEVYSIHLRYPNVIFGENDLIMDMKDMLTLLLQWKAFIGSRRRTN